jgi:hypothetical protein
MIKEILNKGLISFKPLKLKLDSKVLALMTIQFAIPFNFPGTSITDAEKTNY